MWSSCIVDLDTGCLCLMKGGVRLTCSGEVAPAGYKSVLLVQAVLLGG